MSNNGNKAVILILLAIGLFYTFTTAQYTDAQKLNTLAADYNEVLASVAQTIVLRDDLMTQYEKFPKADLERLEKILPSHVDNVRLALDLDGMAARHGISIKSVQTETAIPGDGTLIILPEYALPYEKVIVTFTFVSNYQNFKTLLTEVEKSLRIMDTSLLSFTATENGLYDFKVSVDTYWLK